MKSAVVAVLFLSAISILAGDFFLGAGTAFGGTSVNDSITINIPVTITSVSINNNAAQIILTPNTTTNVNVNASIIDNNGCSQIAGGTTTILLYRSGISSSTCLASSPANPASCYVATAFTASSTCSGTSINTTTTFPVQYYAQATDVSSTFPSQNWMATVSFRDASSSQGSADSTSASTTADIATLVALNTPSASINYGTLLASSTTGSTTQLLNIENAGNASNTIAVNGTALTAGANVIATSSQHYATSSFTYGGTETPLSSGATTITGILTAPVSYFPIGGAGWTNSTALPYFIELHASAAYNGYLYVIGGSVSSVADTSSTLFTSINVDGTLGAWTSMRALPYATEQITSVAYNGYLYTMGGCVNNSCGSIGATSTVLFAPINATGSISAWSPTQAMPTSEYGHTSVVYNGYIYVIGGSITSTVFFAPINATGSIGAWSSTQALPYFVDRHSSVAYNGYLYTIGGAVNGNNNNITSTVLYAPINANGSIGSWSQTQAMPRQKYLDTSAAYNGYLYVIGGATSGTSGTSTVLFAPINATGSIGAWSSTQALSYIDFQHSSIAYNGYLYAIGGGNNTGDNRATFAPLNARSTYWGVARPAGSAKGSYSGTVTFTASFNP